MGVCSTVKMLAQAVLDSGAELDSRQELQLELLKLGPLYLKICNLPLWESALQGTLLDDDQSTVGMLINEVYELAMLNSYAQFDIPKTKEVFRSVVDDFNKNGVWFSVTELDPEGW